MKEDWEKFLWKSYEPDTIEMQERINRRSQRHDQRNETRKRRWKNDEDDEDEEDDGYVDEDVVDDDICEFPLDTSGNSIIELMGYEHAMKTLQAAQWQEAVDNENESLVKMRVFRIIDIADVPEGRKIITGRYAFKLKILYDAATDEYFNKYKARLVGRGFMQENGLDYEETFAAVVKGSSYKIILALAAMY
ncbi:hypothetical protein FHL15_007290 [Xylaria flabelliformis]|uniref:Reverse transcriptase Ty1/copia-type domain-containing protein n=1 Tax=Xylaria flabelliformis TaxID=2512241 RepID=A0A553HUX8_9PEZI|nr:hypothetical protein FHL15_007290 [Xylaria flabelliformis]